MRLNALWWWIDRWRKSTAYTDMTLEEQGAYRNLLDEAQLRGGPLPNDERVLARACGDARAWKRVRPAVIKHFHLAADGWRNDTLDEVIKESARRATNQERYRARRSQHGHKRDNATDNGADNGAGHQRDNNPDNRPASPDPSPDPLPKNGSVPRARASLLGKGLLKPHGHVAFDSPRVWVPWPLHLQLLGFRNNGHAEAELQAFYQDIAAEWTTGAHKDDNVDPEMFAFWKARYAERWPPAKREESHSLTAEELQRQANMAKYRPSKQP